LNTEPGVCIRFIGVQGGEGWHPHGLKIFRANSVFSASASCSKILSDKKYLNTVKIFRATVFFRAIVSSSEVLNDKKYIFNTVNAGHTLFSKTSESCSKILNDKKYIQYREKFKGKDKLLKNPER